MCFIKSLKLFKKYYLTTCPAKGPEKQQDFEMFLKKLNISDYYQQLLFYSSRFDIKVLETINYQSKDYPIYKIEYKCQDSKYKLLIISAVHGNEFATALVIPKLLDDILQNPDFYSKWNIQIIVPANPVGLSYQSRYNQNGYDINRDFKNFSTIEARVQRDVLDDSQPDIIITLHEGPQDGFFITGTKRIDRKLELKIIEALKKENIKLAKKSYLKIPLKTEGLMKEDWFFRFIFYQLLRIYFLENYADKKGTGVITTESPWQEKNIEARIKPHLITIKAIIQNIF